VVTKKTYPRPENFEPTPEFPADHYHFGKPRCLAWNYNKGRQCLAVAWTKKAGIQKCRVHGAKSSRGIASPNFKDGRTSKYFNALPKKNREHYAQALQNPELLRLSEEISLIDSRLLELTEQLDTATSSEIFVRLSGEMQKFEIANRKASRARQIADEERREKEVEKFRAEASEHLSNLRQLISSGSKEWWIWRDITAMIENRRRLVETERKLLTDMQLLISVENVGIQLDRLLMSIATHVTDRDTLQAIQAEFIQLSN